MDVNDAATTRRPIREIAIERVLAMGRERFGMDLAIVCELRGARAALRARDGDVGSFGGFSPSAESPITAVVREILDGHLPMVMSSVVAVDIAQLRVAGVGSFVAAPVRRTDGSALGLFLLVSHFDTPNLDDAAAAEVAILAHAIEKLSDEATDPSPVAGEDEIRDVIESDDIAMVFQPIIDLAHGWTVGWEALARFPHGADRGPDQWFADAERIDRGVQLESMAARSALANLDRIPSGTFLAVNVGPRTLASDGFVDLLEGMPLRRIVLELTGRVTIQDPAPFNRVMDALHSQGARLAVDDAGGGFTSLSAMMELAPDIIKIDPILVRGVEDDPVKRALVAGLVAFAEEVGAITTAEGVESLQEASALRALGVGCAQGHQFGRPAPLT